MGLTGRTPRSLRARRPAAVVIVVVATVLAAVAGTAGPLYAAVYPPDDGAGAPAGGSGDGGPAHGGPDNGGKPPPYPGQDTSVVGSPKEFERSLTRASLTTGFSPEQVVENEQARFTATVTYGRALDPGPKVVQVAYANDAELTSLQPGQFDVTPLTDTRQNLDEGSPDGKGGWSLSWSWDVVPRASGSLTLQLKIEPIVVMDGQVVTELATRNKPIEIDVQVHPHRTEFDAVVNAGNAGFVATPPAEARAGDDALVTADLPLPGPDPDVQVALILTAADDSVPVVIEPKSPAPPAGPDAVRGAWVITPGKDGVAKLAVAAVVTTDVGDKKLEQRIERNVDFVVDPAHTFWPRVLAIVGGLTAFLGLLGALATFRTQYRTSLNRAWDRIRRRPPATDAAAPPPPPSPPPAGS